MLYLMPTHTPPPPVRIWDLPTRLFHGLLIVCVAGLVITGELGGGAMRLHFLFGYGVLTLVLFRLVWGCVGGHWSRFASFVPSPAQLRAYLDALRSHNAPKSIGHNPLGALSVMAMLLMLLLQVLSGFISDDEITATGPWTRLVPNAWIELATQYHADIGKMILIVLVALHVASVLYYKYFKDEDLITPMIRGDKPLPIATPTSRDTLTSRVFALSILLACAYAVYQLVNLAP
jgi:cytochrome b